MKCTSPKKMPNVSPKFYAIPIVILRFHNYFAFIFFSPDVLLGYLNYWWLPNLD